MPLHCATRADPEPERTHLSPVSSPPAFDRRAARVVAQFRQRRWTRMLQWFPDLVEMRIVDLGGELWTWLDAPVRPSEVVLVSLRAPSAHDRVPPWVRIVVGDACDPGLLTGEHFDLAYSNSVIEHVGGHAQRIAFADTANRLSSR